jgi:hypothetical protein
MIEVKNTAYEENIFLNIRMNGVDENIPTY